MCPAIDRRRTRQGVRQHHSLTLVLLALAVHLLTLAPSVHCQETVSPSFTASPQDPLLHTAESRRDGQDSYLAALAQSHGGEEFPPFQGGFYPEGPQPQYGAPSYPEGPYPAPAPGYEYGAPAPAPAPAYGPPYGGHRDHGALKVLEIATVLKILLKVLIFKMIVKFIGVICLLLFLPSLKAKVSSSSSSGSDDEMRALSTWNASGDWASLEVAAQTLWQDLVAAEHRYGALSTSRITRR